MTETPPTPRTEAVRLLGQLLGRHHRQMVVNGEHCTACHNSSITPDDVRRAIEDAGLDVERLARVLAAIHGDNVPFPRGVPTPPREYAELIVDIDARLVSDLTEFDAADAELAALQEQWRWRR